jgi:hypothetical protein
MRDHLRCHSQNPPHHGILLVIFFLQVSTARARAGSGVARSAGFVSVVANGACLFFVLALVMQKKEGEGED